MLSSMRSASKGWVSKLLLLLLVLSFAVWGISDQIGGASLNGAVITAGDTKVSPVEYRLAYNRQLSVASQQLGRRVTQDEARLFGIENQVAGQLVGGAVLDEQARLMKLGISEDRLADLIADDEAFQGLTGQFDRAQFRAVLRNVGMSEGDYIENRKKAAARQQIAEAISDGMKVPSTFMTALAQYQGQTRDVSFIEVDESTLGEIEPPSDAALTEYFEKNKATYRAPEYRAFKTVTLTADSIADESAVADEAVRDEYDNDRDRYSKPEVRTIQQLVFPDKEAAQAAHDRIAAGSTFEAEAETLGRTLADTTLGEFEKSQVPDPKIAEAAFGLNATTDISDVVDGTFGPILVRVTDIKPESVQPFEEVRDEIRKDLAMLEARDVLLNVHDAYEDARAAGSTMEEAAAAQKLKVETVPAIDSQALDVNGNTVDLGEDSNTIVDAVFATEVGNENPPLAAGRDGFIWYEVTDIAQERDRTLDEVRERATQDWITAEKNRLLDEESNRLAEALRNGADMTELAAEKNYRTDSKFGLTRESTDAEFGPRGVAQVFSVGPNEVAFSVAPNGNRRLVFKVNSITNPLGGADNLPAAVSDNVAATLRGDMLDQLVNRLQTEFPVTINQQAIQQAQTRR